MTCTKSSPASPRSIFGSYWSSPTNKKSSSGSERHGDDHHDDDDEILKRLQKLRMPPLATGATGCRIVDAPSAPAIEQKPSHDDDSVDYYHPPQAAANTRTARRKIMPTPPPATAVSSSLILPRRPPPARGLDRKWLSASALLGGDGRRGNPHQSCLRKSRYSCSAIPTDATGGGGSRIHRGQRNEGRHDLLDSSDRREDLKKSVSFYSHVSVFEFAVPAHQRKGQRGWSTYFAS
jgi:hypothetical protein